MKPGGALVTFLEGLGVLPPLPPPSDGGPAKPRTVQVAVETPDGVRPVQVSEEIAEALVRVLEENGADDADRTASLPTPEALAPIAAMMEEHRAKVGDMRLSPPITRTPPTVEVDRPSWVVHRNRPKGLKAKRRLERDRKRQGRNARKRK